PVHGALRGPSAPPDSLLPTASDRRRQRTRSCRRPPSPSLLPSLRAQLSQFEPHPYPARILNWPGRLPEPMPESKIASSPILLFQLGEVGLNARFHYVARMKMALIGRRNGHASDLTPLHQLASQLASALQRRRNGGRHAVSFRADRH